MWSFSDLVGGLSAKCGPLFELQISLSLLKPARPFSGLQRHLKPGGQSIDLLPAGRTRFPAGPVSATQKLVTQVGRASRIEARPAVLKFAKALKAWRSKA
jgi:hypothetical protein